MPEGSRERGGRKHRTALIIERGCRKHRTALIIERITDIAIALRLGYM